MPLAHVAASQKYVVGEGAFLREAEMVVLSCCDSGRGKVRALTLQLGSLH